MPTSHGNMADSGPSMSSSGGHGKPSGQLNLESVKRNSGAPLKSPCFVHSYLDSGLGNFRTYFDSQQGASIPEHPAVESKDADLLHEGGGAGISSSEVHSANSNTSSRQDDTVTGEAKIRRSSTRPQPMHRGMRGAVEPDSDDEVSSNDDEDSTTSSYEDTYISSEEEAEESRVRSLTRQLAETAVGVREMSKQLGRARVKSTIQSVLIITKARDNHLIKLTRELAIWLMNTPRNGRGVGLTVYVDSQLRQSKRFDAEGIRNDYPHLFSPSSARMQSSNGSADATASNGSLPDAPKSAQSSTSLASSRNGSVSQLRDESLLRYWTSDMCSRSPHLFDFVVTLGGDGTVLFCSWLFQRIVPPVMPFALGSLGFLTNFDFKDYKKVVQSALETGIRVNLRMRFTATVYRATFPSDSKMDKKKRRAIKSGKTGEIIMKSVQEVGWESIETPLPQNGDLRGSQTEDDFNGEDEDDRRPSVSESKPRKDKEIMCFSTRPVETFEVLNDLVVDRGPSPYVSLLEVFGDEHHLTTAQADGLCISTPTGSTAYSLSAGGSLVHPEIPAILISPICPHTLSFRPMLLPDSMELRIAVPYNSRSTAWASFDGRGRVELKQGDHIKVTASKYPFPTVCADNQSKDWFESISRTLKWNERQRQKSFVVVEEGDEEQISDPPAQTSSQRNAEKSAMKGVRMFNQENVKHSSSSKNTKSSDDEGDDEDEEQEEHFDIEDTSQAATRVSSPAPPGTPNLSRRHSTTSDGRRHHHHHKHGQRTRSSNGSYPNSASGSSSALPMFGLTPMTSTADRDGSSTAAAKSGNVAAPSSATKVSFDSRIPSDDSSGGSKYQHGVVQPSSRSLLDSPDRFGRAGPPDPPQALSERHLATADFRLDDDPDRESEREGRKATEEAEKSSTKKRTSSVQRGQDDALRPSANERHLRDSVVKAAESKAKIASSTNKLYKKVKGRASSSHRGASKARPHAHAENTDGFSGGFDLGRTDSRKAGGAALVVYGQDESDSDSTAEG